jgi:hypothetical protein
MANYCRAVIKSLRGTTFMFCRSHSSVTTIVCVDFGDVSDFLNFFRRLSMSDMNTEYQLAGHVTCEVFYVTTLSLI